MSKSNGSMNGSGRKPGEGDEDKIVRFPSLAERKRKIMQGATKKPAPVAVPFFNLSLIPPFTRVIVLSFLVVQIALTFVPDDLKIQIFYTFGFVPAYFSGVNKPFPIGAAFSPFTHIFIHGGWIHLAFNSVMALTLGMLFEREFGTRRAVIFFFVCGLAGALAYFILNPISTAPVIGASGSVSGFFGALIIMLSRSRIPGGRSKNPWPIIGFWIAFMVLSGMIGSSSLAWQAHIGGFLAGIGLLHLMQSGKLKI